MRIGSLFVYPVKSCRGIALEHAELDRRGIRHDREWMVVRPDGQFLSQRTHPRLALVETALDDQHLTLTRPAAEPLTVLLAAEPGPPLTVQVWNDTCQAIDQGEAAAQWFSELLAQPVRLVRMAPDWVRPVKPDYEPSGISVGFADAFPLLVISEASLADLNRRLGRGLPMDRFRPNVVIEGAPAYAEDSWDRIQAGTLVLQGASLCTRCKITTIDQQTAISEGSEPLRTLTGYRPLRDNVTTFGRNMVHQQPGSLALGDPVTVL